MPKGSKIPLLGLNAKGQKNRKIRNKHPEMFCHIFQGKKELFKSDHQKYELGGRVPLGSTLYCVLTCIDV